MIHPIDAIKGIFTRIIVDMDYGLPRTLLGIIIGSGLAI